MAVVATFVPQIGNSASVRAIKHAPDVFHNVGSSVVETPTTVLLVRVSDCPTIIRGDQFIIGTTTYTVQGSPVRDDLQLIWEIDVFAS